MPTIYGAMWEMYRGDNHVLCAEQASRLTPANNRWAGLTQQARPVLILGGSLDGQMRWTRNVPWYTALLQPCPR